MQIVDIRIRNFRSIEAEQHVPIPGRMTLVGPNNSGKTNILRALQVLFTGYENTYGYTRSGDLTFGVGRARTSIIATFDGDPIEDATTYQEVDELHKLQGTVRDGTQLTLTLYFTDTNTPVYSFFPNVKRPTAGTQSAQYSRIHKDLVIALLKSFGLHYVPSAKSVKQIYDELLTPFLRRKVAKVLEPRIIDIENSLAEAASALNKELKNAGLSEFSAGFSLPNESMERLVSGFDFMISDPQKTPIQDKGMGVQTTALLAAFRWITKQESEAGRNVIWLLEEPESYLHPNLAVNCSAILDNLAENAIVVKTTHSMAFVPQEPQFVCGTRLSEKGRTEIVRFTTFNHAVSSIRSALGIKFGEFYNLARFNVLVEGQTDRELFEWFLTKVPNSVEAWAFLRQAKFEDFGGVKHLSGFLRATYQFIRDESACVSVFDGDEAGEKERRSLQGYFGNKNIPFEANEHFVSVRASFAIEGLFPDEWIIDIHDAHPDWFETYSVDAAGQLEPFRIRDNRKSNVLNTLISRAGNEPDIEWGTRFRRVCSVLNEALGKQESARIRRAKE